MTTADHLIRTSFSPAQQRELRDMTAEQIGERVTAKMRENFSAWAAAPGNAQRLTQAGANMGRNGTALDDLLDEAHGLKRPRSIIAFVPVNR